MVVEKNFAKSGLNISAIRRFGLLMASSTLMLGGVGLNHQVNAAPTISNKVPRESLFERMGCATLQAKGTPDPGDAYDAVITLNPNDALAYYDRGRYRAFIGVVQEQIDDYDQALRIDPSYADVYYRRGITRYLAGDRLGGYADLSKAADLLMHKKDTQAQQEGLEIIQNLHQPISGMHLWILNHQIWGCID